MAAVAASVFGVGEADALRSMSTVREVEGRFSVVRVDGVATRLLLAKNPAGWAELLDLLTGSDLPIVVGINSRIADGHDPSWLWDVPFEDVSGHKLVATGERCLDLAVRFKYAGLEHRVERSQRKAIVAVGESAVDYVGNYTAFQQLRRSVAGGGRNLKRSDLAVAGSPMYEARPVPVAGRSAGESALRIAVVHPDSLVPTNPFRLLTSTASVAARTGHRWRRQNSCVRASSQERCRPGPSCSPSAQDSR
jgi:hypothetical protein